MPLRIPFEIIGLMACHTLYSILMSNGTIIKHFFHDKKNIFRFSLPPAQKKTLIVRHFNLNSPSNTCPRGFSPAHRIGLSYLFRSAWRNKGVFFLQTVSFSCFFGLRPYWLISKPKSSARVSRQSGYESVSKKLIAFFGVLPILIIRHYLR